MRAGIFVLICALLLGCHSEPGEESVSEENLTQQQEEGSVASSDGVPIAYAIEGRGDIALVFIHGGFYDSSVWSNQVDVFTDDYQVVTLDLAGHGGSGTNRDKWTLEAFGGDVRAVVEALDLERVLLIGHSMGGPVMLEAAQLMPERVIGLIAVDTLQNADFEWHEEAWEDRIEAYRKNFPNACREMADQMFPADADQDLVAMIMDKMCRMPPVIAIAIFENYPSYDIAAAMGAVTVPIRGINADLWPTNMEGNRKYAPGYDAVIMEGVGHFPMLERPGEFNSHLARIVDQLTRE